MSREVKEDFAELTKFIEDYNLSTSSTFLKTLSPMHKKYFSLITITSEYINGKDDNNAELLSDKQKIFILEMVSDIGSSYFLCINGAYKPARLMLRSSIETFLKGLFIIELPNIDREKRVYKIFDDINELTFFSEDHNKKEFDDLNMYYSDLSQDVHSASLVQMMHISSLNFFPSFSTSEINKISKLFCRLVSIYLNLFATYYNTFFNKIHYKNKDIILSNIRRKHRSRIQNL